MQICQRAPRSYESEKNKIPYFSGEIIMAKWTNIRDSFLRSLRTKNGQEAKKAIYTANIFNFF